MAILRVTEPSVVVVSASLVIIMPLYCTMVMSSPWVKSAEMNDQVQNISYSLQMQGISLDQWLMFNGKSEEEFADDLREGSSKSARVDLALRAVAVAEGLTATDEDIDAEIAELSVQVGDKPAAVRARLEENDNLLSLRADLTKRAALEWLLERVAIVDEDSGDPIDRAQLEEPVEESTGSDTEADDADPEVDE